MAAWEWGTASDGRNVYAAVSDSVRIAGDTHEVAPVGDANFDPKLGGGLTALAVASGEKLVVRTRPCLRAGAAGVQPGAAGAVSAMRARYFREAWNGHVRAFSTADGKVLWDADTAKTYKAWNGVPARGRRAQWRRPRDRWRHGSRELRLSPPRREARQCALGVWPAGFVTSLSSPAKRGRCRASRGGGGI